MRVIISERKIEIALRSEFMNIWMKYVKAKAIGVDSFIRIYFRLAVYSQIELILAVIYLYIFRATFEYSWLIYSLKILRNVDSFLLYIWS